MRYNVVLTAAAAEDFRRLDGSLKEPVAKQLRKLEASPRLGEHLGHRADLGLTDYYKDIDPHRVPDHRPRNSGRSRRCWKTGRSRGLSGSTQTVHTAEAIRTDPPRLHEPITVSPSSPTANAFCEIGLNAGDPHSLQVSPRVPDWRRRKVKPPISH